MTKGYTGKILTDKSDELPKEATPIEWEAPSLSMPNEEFYKYRYTFCVYYTSCLNYAAGLHWPGWSCCWCVYNPYGQNFKKALDPIEELSRLVEKLKYAKEAN